LRHEPTDIEGDPSSRDYGEVHLIQFVGQKLSPIAFAIALLITSDARCKMSIPFGGFGVRMPEQLTNDGKAKSGARTDAREGVS
jgi:hypothetical protein